MCSGLINTMSSRIMGMGDDDVQNSSKVAEDEDLWEAFGSESSDESGKDEAATATEKHASTGSSQPIVLLDGNDAINFEIFEQSLNNHGGGGGHGGGGPSRGKGLRSLKSFARGDEILRERATICVANEHAATSLHEAQVLHAHSVQRAYDNLSPIEQRAVMALSNCGKYYCNTSYNDNDNSINGSSGSSSTASPIIDQELQGIFHTNSYRLTSTSSSGTMDAEDGDYDYGDCVQKDSGLFLTVARINHSCRPNVSHCWRPDLQRFLIFATKSIAVGDELVASYLPIMLVGDGFTSNGGGGGAEVATTKGRREFLRERFSFHCICEMCCEHDNNKQGVGAADDQRMARIAQLLDTTIPDLVAFRQYEKAVKAVDTSLCLLQQQGLTGGIYTRSLLQHGYQIAASSGNHQLAMSYLERQLVAVIESKGTGCPEALRIQDHITSMSQESQLLP